MPNIQRSFRSVSIALSPHRLRRTRRTVADAVLAAVEFAGAPDASEELRAVLAEEGPVADALARVAVADPVAAAAAAPAPGSFELPRCASSHA